MSGRAAFLLGRASAEMDLDFLAAMNRCAQETLPATSDRLGRRFGVFTRSAAFQLDDVPIPQLGGDSVGRGAEKQDNTPITQYAAAVGVECQSAPGLAMQFRDGLVSTDMPMSDDDESDDSRKWYVRLRIRDDRLAKLWVWKLADHDVIVWSESDDRWKRLLSVPELRAAVRRATTSAYARKRPTSESPPAPWESPARPHRATQQSLAELDFEEPPTRLRRALDLKRGREDEEAPTRVRPQSIVPAYSEPPAKSVDPLLHALTTSIPPAAHPLTTSIPPAVHSTPAPEIPRAPRVPSFLPSSSPPLLRQSSRTRPQLVRAAPRVLSQFSVKNISWAMLPVACAGIFAVYLDRNPSVIERTVATQSASASAGGIAPDGDVSNEKLASFLVGAGPMCAGQAPEAQRALSPDQLAAIPSFNAKTGATRASSAKALGGSVPRKTNGQVAPAAVSLASSASGEGNEFDREGAKTALRFAIARVRNCSNSGLSGSALITFAPGGTVQRVQLNQLDGDDVDPSCVTRALSASRVPPFSGGPVTVRKSF